MERQLRAEVALFATAKDVVQLLRWKAQRTMQVVRPGRMDSKPFVVALSKAGEEGVAGFHVVDTGQTQFLDQAVLQDTVGLF